MFAKDQKKLCEAIYSSQHYKDWQKIAKASKQCETNDVAQDAFLFIIEHWTKEFDLTNDEHWHELKHKMWNKFVHRADRLLKNAFDFDQGARNDLDEAINPILLSISSPTSTEPLQGLIDAEEQQTLQKKQVKQIQENSFSMALAYVQLFESLKPKLLKYTYLNIADYMKMSYSWLRECIKRAEKLQKTQYSLFDNIEYASVPHLGSWRKFKLERQVQPKFTPVLENQLNLFQHRL
ncbi:hypothetical protein [Acinetobacter haemolyticus]|uniref:Uncharacterized protein n=1 Tax=Acinetobacter haemolyticus TaxID=29430 RepID=A0A857IG49_ACIHA|nr:hypothetical protein [Acinetobacter haemolyticus]QHI08819.1 hypothetical protein AhaeAN59_01115 [Acinetobacter haemolyticus]QHI12086.1 hypothetical protein AhaeAN43_01110 [Acinetobacter haemolyticus]